MYEHDVIIDRGEILKRKKKPSKRFQDEFCHTPLSVEADIPWKRRQLIIGTGAYGRLPVIEKVKREARRRRVELLILPTAEAIETLGQDPVVLGGGNARLMHELPRSVHPWAKLECISGRMPAMARRTQTGKRDLNCRHTYRLNMMSRVCIVAQPWNS